MYENERHTNSASGENVGLRTSVLAGVGGIVGTLDLHLARCDDSDIHVTSTAQIVENTGGDGLVN